MRKFGIAVLAVALAGICVTPAFAGDTCGGSVLGNHAGWTDSYGTAADFSSTTNHILYYDYNNPTSNIVDSTADTSATGCQNFDLNGAEGNGIIDFTTWNQGYILGLQWTNNNGCSTIVGNCDGFPIDATDRMALVVYTTTTSAPYTAKILTDTVRGAYPANPTGYDFGQSAGGHNKPLFTMTAPIILSSSGCVIDLDGLGALRGSCNIVVRITEPTFNGAGASGGIYGDVGATAQGIIAGYEIVGLQAAGCGVGVGCPANGLATNFTMNMNAGETDQFIPASNPPAGGFVTSGTITVLHNNNDVVNNFRLAYVPIFRSATGCGGATCTAVELQNLSALGLRSRIASAASSPISPTPTPVTAGSGSYVDLQNVKLTWETTQEVDTAGFNIYRSTDQTNWTKLNDNLYPANGTAGGGASYTYNDRLPRQRTYGKYFYRVDQMDNSGNVQDSFELEVSKN